MLTQYPWLCFFSPYWKLSMPQRGPGIPDQLLNVGTGLAPDLVTLWSGTIVTSPTNPRLKPDRTVTQG
ncbi:hypothetical protein [Pedobacter frigidisoli]|uniref:hypothetical protein n=1 Tax=Pedobacter frigidisoli TaxID=2530455 RepID=UPI00292F9488|nr:hypothetical protein [Pedobacter frigidisoli]